MGNFFNAILVHPLENILIFFTWLVPGHNAFWGIVLLTLLVRFILLIPSKRAAQSQRKLNELAPLMDELKKEYGNDKQGLSTAQMELYKKNNINPFASCLPTVVQLPIILALYRAILAGLTTHPSGLYSWVPRPEHIVTQFLWVNLVHPDQYFIIPLIAAGLQYFQVRMTLPKPRKLAPGETEDQSVAMQRMMVYLSPLMTLFIARTFPSGAAVYWAVQAGFAIVQQAPIYREKLKLQGLSEAVQVAEIAHPENKKETEKVLKELKPLEVKTTDKKGVSVTVRKKGSSKYTAGE
jgi:YidC/Oxa1 family membrane protein insertase